MSSKNFLSQTIALSEELVHAKTIEGSEDDESNNKDLDDEAERERLEIWSSIQRNKKEEQEKSGSFDTWSSIISLKGKDEISKSLPASLYVHPLVKRSKSCLSEKSLQICTESLGSETGSDGLLSSSYSSTETGDAEEQEKVAEPTHQEEEELSNYASVVVATKKASSPTPGPSLHMRSRRDNGRLVLEAVSVPSHNNFSIQRQGGRLVLSFSNHQEEDEEEEEEDAEEEYAFGTKGHLLSSEVTSNVQGLALMTNNKKKTIGVVNRSPKWSEKFDEMTNFNDVNVAQSLPPRPRVAAAAASFNFNAYEYYWRTKDMNKMVPREQQQVLVLRGKNGDYLVHNLKSCKDSRRSFLFWEPYCIATS
ncbi:hypothetical protein V8G54_025028 [Vigna mungo]|uniref:FAF domain-containing protein n=1 Tax=Vigna mungo TaxID=3915 RepID=A0AAQ3N7Y8_VIGMU